MSNEPLPLAYDVLCRRYGVSTLEGLIDVLVKETKLGVHITHCNFGEHAGQCKYGDVDCLALTESFSWIGQAIDRSVAPTGMTTRPCEYTYDHQQSPIAVTFHTFSMHTWGNGGAKTVAVIEHDSGMVELVEATRIKFTDREQTT